MFKRMHLVRSDRGIDHAGKTARDLGILVLR
jgi:hypothetical protein